MVAYFLIFVLISLIATESGSSFFDGATSIDGRRIVKGFEIDIEEFPHAVFLYFDVRRPSTCGSSLVRSSVVVSSAHCLRELSVLNGAIHAYLGGTIPMYAKAVRNIVKFRIHPRYHPVKGKFDLGVAKLEKPVTFIRGIHKIPLAKNGPYIDAALYTAGWGKHWPNVLPDYSDTRHLKVSKQRILSHRECLNQTGIRISPPYLCTLPINGFHYRGDMGNGLVWIRNGKKRLVGVVSFMVRDSTLYASVIKERDWILDVMKKI